MGTYWLHTPPDVEYFTLIYAEFEYENGVVATVVNINAFGGGLEVENGNILSEMPTEDMTQIDKDNFINYILENVNYDRQVTKTTGV